MNVMKWFLFPLLLGSLSAMAEPAREPLHIYRLLSLSVYDELAVIKGEDGKLITLKPGDLLLNGAYSLSKIKADSIVLADETRPGDSVLVYLSQGGKASRIQRISPVVPDELQQPQAAYKVEVHR